MNPVSTRPASTPTSGRRTTCSRHVNGRWLATTEIPEDRGRYGSFDVLRETAEEHVRAIIEEVAAGAPEAGHGRAPRSATSTPSFMDEERRRGARRRARSPTTSRRSPRSRTPATSSRSTGALERARRARRSSARSSTPTTATPSRYVVYLEQGGLGLPDESYYREDAVRRHAHRLRRPRRADARPSPAGPTPRAPPARVMALETRLAAGALGQGDQPRRRQDLQPRRPRRASPSWRPGVAWARYLEGLGARRAAFDEVVVRQPELVRSMAARARARSRSRTGATGWPGTSCTRSAPYLSAAFVEENFDFYGRTLPGMPRDARALEARRRPGRGGRSARPSGSSTSSGTSRPTPRSAWTSSSPTSSRPTGAASSRLEWMGDETRREALAKLEPVHARRSATPTRGATTPRSRSTPATCSATCAARAAFEFDRQLAQARRAGRPRRVVHDAADGQRLLQPGHERDRLPGRDPAAAVLRPRGRRRRQLRRHRRGHRPRDRPRLRRPGLAVRRRPATCATGGPTRTARAFEARADALIAQYDALRARDAARRTRSTARSPSARTSATSAASPSATRPTASRSATSRPPEIDGLTGEQRFFLGWAQVWRGQGPREPRPSGCSPSTRTRPMDLRANAVRNLNEFHEAFGVERGRRHVAGARRPGAHLLTRGREPDAVRRGPAAGAVAGLGACRAAARMTG